MGERLAGSQKVIGSNPLSSIKLRLAELFCFLRFPFFSVSRLCLLKAFNVKNKRDLFLSRFFNCSSSFQVNVNSTSSQRQLNVNSTSTSTQRQLNSTQRQLNSTSTQRQLNVNSTSTQRQVNVNSTSTSTQRQLNVNSTKINAQNRNRTRRRAPRLLHALNATVVLKRPLAPLYSFPHFPQTTRKKKRNPTRRRAPLPKLFALDDLNRQKRNCRRASKDATATLTDKFKLRICGRIGIRKPRSGLASQKESGKPRDSGPKTNTSPRRYSTAS